jgi:hypothetical protein
MDFLIIISKMIDRNLKNIYCSELAVKNKVYFGQVSSFKVYCETLRIMNIISDNKYEV